MENFFKSLLKWQRDPNDCFENFPSYKFNDWKPWLTHIENLMQGNNVEIQGVPTFENENVEMVAMKVLKKVDPRLERHHMGKIRRLRTIEAISNQEKKE